MTRSAYLRDIVADLPVFRDRDRPLPMAPKARRSRGTAASLPPRPQRDRVEEPAARGLPAWFTAVPAVGDIEVTYDDSVADGIIEIDGTSVAIAAIVAAVAAARGDAS